MSKTYRGKSKGRLLFLLIILVSWYHPGIFNKTLEDARIMLGTVKSFFCKSSSRRD